jgi:hypothetical protein
MRSIIDHRSHCFPSRRVSLLSVAVLELLAAFEQVHPRVLSSPEEPSELYGRRTAPQD